MPLDTTNPFNVKVDHNFAKIDDAIGFFPRTWRAAKKYSIGNTLPIAAVNTWLQFSLAYVAAIIITSNNLSFITDIFNPTFMPVYALVSVILLTTFVASSAMKYMHKQEIKGGEKSIEELINDKIRGGKDNEVSEIAENALKIEIIPVIGRKKANFSIVLPVSENQKKILESQREENKNKAIFLTIPHAISALIIVGALIQNRFSFANVQGWEWTVVALASTIAIVRICITFSKLKNNEISNYHNHVKRFHNIDIIFPCRGGGVVSVMEKKTKDEEENDSISRLIKLLDEHLSDFTDKIVDSFDKQLGEAKGLLDNSLLKPANDEIKETLVHLQGIREDIKKDLDELHKEISTVLGEAKGLTRRASSLNIESIFFSLENAIKIAEDKIERFEPSRFVGFFQSGERAANNNHEFLCMLKKQEEEAEKDKTELKEQLKKVKDELEQLKNKQTQSTEPNSNKGSTSATPLEKQQDEEKKAMEKHKLLKSKKRTKELEKENAKWEKELPEQERMDEWREKINGKVSDFLYYLLESIKLEEKDTKEERGELTLRDFDNKIIIHWKDGSQIIFDIKKQHDLQVQPNTKVDFVDPDIHSAFEVACTG